MSVSVKHSVIIPVYNAENTLARCVDSLLSQKCAEAEIILVNDGSTDSSGALCEQYAREHTCVRYISKENGGVSSARNLGLTYATGKYIMFVDSDDYVPDDCFRVLEEMEDEDALLVFSISDGKTDNYATELSEGNTYLEILDRLLLSRRLMNPVGKCFLRKTIEEKNIRFIEGLHIGEDFLFCLTYSLHVDTIRDTGRPLYCVDVSNLHSLSRKYRPDLTSSMIRVFVQARKIVSESLLAESDKEVLLCSLDYLCLKNVFTCSAEHLKTTETGYFQNRSRIRDICVQFEQNRGKPCGYKNWIHAILSAVVKLRLSTLIYLAVYLIKGKSYRRHREEAYE